LLLAFSAFDYKPVFISCIFMHIQRALEAEPFPFFLLIEAAADSAELVHVFGFYDNNGFKIIALDV
jgi:hypothetical protein